MYAFDYKKLLQLSLFVRHHNCPFYKSDSLCFLPKVSPPQIFSLNVLWCLLALELYNVLKYYHVSYHAWITVHFA